MDNVVVFMKFVSNIGWISKNTQMFNFEILNHQYLFNIQINEMLDLVSGKKSTVQFSIPLKKIIGTSTLSNSGQMIFFDIEGKRFGTPVKLLQKVFISGCKKPLSEIVNRSDNQIEKYAIYDSILKCLLQGSSSNVSQDLKRFENPIKDLIKKFHGDNADPLDYNDPNLQSAYMLCYFPYYIENIYHLLHYIERSEINYIFKNDMRINLYGCGPAPDLLGFLAFLNKKYRPIISHINVNFFDNHNWEYWRGECINNYSRLFKNNIDITTSTSEMNLLECDNPSYVAEKNLCSSEIHIFQNCTTDLYNQCRSNHKIGSIFNTLCDHINPGSILIIIDFIGKGDSMTILNSIKRKLSDNNKIKFLDDTYNVHEYKPGFIKNPEVQMFLNQCYQKANKMPRESTGYSYLVVQRK